MFSFKKIWKHLWPQIKKFKWSFYLTFLTYGIGIIVINVFRPIVYKRIIDVLSTSTPNIVVANSLMLLLATLIFIIFIQQVFYRFGDNFVTYFQRNVIKEIHNYSFEQIQKQSYSFFTSNFTGSLIAKTKRFARAFEDMHDILIFGFYWTFMVLLGILVSMYIIIPKIAIIFIAWTFIYVFITILFLGKKEKLDEKTASADSEVTAGFSDVLTNLFNVKIFAGLNYENKRFKKITNYELERRTKSWRYNNFQLITQGILMSSLEIILVYIMLKMWLVNTISTGTFVLVQSYLIIIFDHLWNLGKDMIKFIKYKADMQEIVNILDQTPDILDPENPEELKIKSGNIKFENVSFEYLEGKEVFSNFNLEIKPGERIGLVGHSGSGKSTITKLLLRFADIKEGIISIDEQNIRNITQDDLRSTISYVPQEPILFHRTIRENIAYARPDSSEEEIIEAAKSAHAHDFITGLQNGYDTLVGERGVKLSGGERQRVAIARAMLKHAPILILDEATSSLDSLSESYIQDAFNKLMENKTTIVIAHRLSTIQKMDRIIVLNHGSIAEEGTHKELLKKKGIYAELWDHQTGGFIE